MRAELEKPHKYPSAPDPRSAELDGGDEIVGVLVVASGDVAKLALAVEPAGEDKAPGVVGLRRKLVQAFVLAALERMASVS